MAYLCVNKSGQELVCQNEPERYGLVRAESKSPFDRLDKETGKRYKMEESNRQNLAFWKDTEILNMGEFYIDYTIELPTGTIQKILGHDLTWSNSPVEI